MSLMTTTVRRPLLPRLSPPSQLLPSKKKSQLQLRNPNRLPLQLKRTRTISLRPNLLKIRVKVVMPLQPKMVTVVAEVVAVVDAITTGEVEIETTIGEVEIVEIAVDAAVTEATTAAAVAAIASLTKTKTASLWRLERSPSHVTEATTEVAEVTVVNLEGVTVATAMETAVVAVAVVADPKLLTEVTMALPAKNNSQLLAKSERRQARTDKVKCE